MKRFSFSADKRAAGVGRYHYLAMSGHICADLTQGALPAILPFLIAKYGLSYAEAAGIVFASNLVSSVIQPLFGYLGDRIRRPWFMAVGIMAAGAGISFLGICGSYTLMCAASVVMGTGVALFHPEGGKLARIVSGDRQGTGMSVFSVGGNIGFVIGPLYASVAILLFGLKGTFAFLLPTAAMSAVMLANNSKIKTLLTRHYEDKSKTGRACEPDNPKGFAIVSLLMVFRSIVGISLNIFIPLFWIGILFQSEAVGNANLSVFAVAGALATLAGGRLADKLGFRKVIVFCCCLTPPLMLFFCLNRHLLLATVTGMLISFALNGAHSTIIVTGQNFLPNRIGMASGILFGLTISVGGMFSPVVGWVGDRFGLETALFLLTALSIPAMILAFAIPTRRKE
ncbi:MAG: MFS transporter [Clostridiales Family XIII bacterium]|jgi:FSR family fosmidomycin resistance protein-like MFS transporter|nr:MFS transporter [Clostridiales Family XIII bacterium]